MQPPNGYCPMCNGDGVPLGPLGCLFWFKCRQCGLPFFVDLKKRATKRAEKKAVKEAKAVKAAKALPAPKHNQIKNPCYQGDTIPGCGGATSNDSY